jgi:hypothetical protein
MPRLGEILVAMRACDPERVREALECQVLYGGRLGTNLLEICNAVTEEVLASALERQHGARTLFGDVAVDRSAVGLLDRGQADQLEVVPLRLAGRRLAVLCADPRDLPRLDAVAFATGKAIEPVVVPEARLWALLRAHYGVERQLRGIDVPWARAARPPPASVLPPSLAAAVGDLIAEEEFEAMYQQLTPETARPGAPAAPRLPPSPAPASRPLAETPRRETAAPPPRPGGITPPPLPRRAPASDPLFSFPPAPPVSARVVVPAAPLVLPPLPFAEAVAALARVSDRSAIAAVVLRHARSHFRRALLLSVHPRSADGWQGLGDGLTPERVARVHVPLGEPGVVRTVVESRSHFLGPLARTDANIALLRALGDGAPKTSFAMPVLARGRVVNVLYADDGRGRMVNPDGLGELLILSSKIAQSYDGLVARAR